MGRFFRQTGKRLLGYHLESDALSSAYNILSRQKLGNRREMEATPEAGIKPSHPQLTLDPHPATPYNPPMKPLSKIQEDMRDFVDEFVEKMKHPPTVREVQEFFKMSSPSVVVHHLKRIKKHGWKCPMKTTIIDPDVEAIRACCLALEKSSSREALINNINYIIARYKATP